MRRMNFSEKTSGAGLEASVWRAMAFTTVSMFFTR